MRKIFKQNRKNLDEISTVLQQRIFWIPWPQVRDYHSRTFKFIVTATVSGWVYWYFFCNLGHIHGGNSFGDIILSHLPPLSQNNAIKSKAAILTKVTNDVLRLKAWFDILQRLINVWKQKKGTYYKKIAIISGLWCLCSCLCVCLCLCIYICFRNRFSLNK